jgi:hypothetical protein
MQANRATILLDPVSHRESELDDIPDAVRAYPASAGSVMFPLTPANNWTATVMFCGGTDNDDWSTDWDIASFPASTSCVTITPDRNGSYKHTDPLPEGRSMSNLVFLPDGRILAVNGARLGAASCFLCRNFVADSLGQARLDMGTNRGRLGCRMRTHLC